MVMRFTSGWFQVWGLRASFRVLSFGAESFFGSHLFRLMPSLSRRYVGWRVQHPLSTFKGSPDTGCEASITGVSTVCWVRWVSL